MNAEGRRNCNGDGTQQRQQPITDATDLDRRNGTDTANCRSFWNCNGKNLRADRLGTATFARQALTKVFAVAANPRRFRRSIRGIRDKAVDVAVAVSAAFCVHLRPRPARPKHSIRLQEDTLTAARNGGP